MKMRSPVLLLAVLMLVVSINTQPAEAIFPFLIPTLFKAAPSIISLFGKKKKKRKSNQSSSNNMNKTTTTTTSTQGAPVANPQNPDLIIPGPITTSSTTTTTSNNSNSSNNNNSQSGGGRCPFFLPYCHIHRKIAKGAGNVLGRMFAPKKSSPPPYTAPPPGSGVIQPPAPQYVPPPPAQPAAVFTPPAFQPVGY